MVIAPLPITFSKVTVPCAKALAVAPTQTAPMMIVLFRRCFLLFAPPQIPNHSHAQPADRKRGWLRVEVGQNQVAIPAGGVHRVAGWRRGWIARPIHEFRSLTEQRTR